MKRLNKRAVISILLLISLIAMPVTGGLIHISHGKTMEHSWLHFHAISGFIFVILGIYHLIFNWKAMKRYLTDFMYN